MKRSRATILTATVALGLLAGGSVFAAGGPGTNGVRGLVQVMEPGTMMNSPSLDQGTITPGRKPGSLVGGCPGGATMSRWLGGSFPGRLISMDQAVRDVQRYIKRFNNPHLVVGEVIQFQHNFYAIVNDTASGHGAFEVLINNRTGQVFIEYPSMLWNTEYGMMRHMHGFFPAKGRMRISATQARRIAQNWLNLYRPGASVEAPNQFPSYYTVHFLQAGNVAGMLSVNGFTGQIWYHGWHGAFVQKRELNG